jgi:hypothetical protein
MLIISLSRDLVAPSLFVFGSEFSIYRLFPLAPLYAILVDLRISPPVKKYSISFVQNVEDRELEIRCSLIPNEATGRSRRLLGLNIIIYYIIFINPFALFFSHLLLLLRNININSQ